MLFQALLILLRDTQNEILHAVHFHTMRVNVDKCCQAPTMRKKQVIKVCDLLNNLQYIHLFSDFLTFYVCFH